MADPGDDILRMQEAQTFLERTLDAVGEEIEAIKRDLRSVSARVSALESAARGADEAGAPDEGDTDERP